MIFRSGPFAPDGVPVLYNSRYGGGDRNEVRRWQLTGAKLDALTSIPGDNGAAFYSGFTDHGIVSFTAGPDGSLYYSDSGQGSSNANQRMGRIRYVAGTAPVANFTLSAATGQAPLAVTLTDQSSAPGSSIGSRAWSFGDGGTSTAVSPSHIFTQPGVYHVALTVTNAQGLTQTKESVVTVYQETSVTLTGDVFDARTLAAPRLQAATELHFYQADGMTPLAVSGGTGTGSNILPVTAGAIQATFTARITGPGMVVSAGEAAEDGVQPAWVGVALSTSAASQQAAVTFRLSDTLIRGRVLDTLGAPARVDVGVSRGSVAVPYAFAGGRDFLAGHAPSGVNHRTVPDALGYYHVPVLGGDGGASFFLDTTADTLVASHGKVTASLTVANGASATKDLKIGLYDGGTGEADLSGIAPTPGVNFESQIQTIFTTSCVACHDGIATNSGGLDLRSGFSLAALVNVISAEAPGIRLVEPGSAERSYLMEKINAAVPQTGTSMRPGDPMPLAQRALIRDWINQLAGADAFQSWQTAQFGSEAGLPQAHADGDYDHDGLANLLEYVLGSDPKASQADPGYSVATEADGKIRFRFREAAQLPGITLRVLAADSLDAAAWQAVATKTGSAAWTTTSGVTVSEATGTVTVTDSVSVAEHPSRFYRLEATR